MSDYNQFQQQCQELCSSACQSSSPSQVNENILKALLQKVHTNSLGESFLQKRGPVSADSTACPNAHLIKFFKPNPDASQNLGGQSRRACPFEKVNFDEEKQSNPITQTQPYQLLKNLVEASQRKQQPNQVSQFDNTHFQEQIGKLQNQQNRIQNQPFSLFSNQFQMKQNLTNAGIPQQNEFNNASFAKQQISEPFNASNCFNNQFNNSIFESSNGSPTELGLNRDGALLDLHKKIFNAMPKQDVLEIIKKQINIHKQKKLEAQKNIDHWVQMGKALYADEDFEDSEPQTTKSTTLKKCVMRDPTTNKEEVCCYIQDDKVKRPYKSRYDKNAEPNRKSHRLQNIEPEDEAQCSLKYTDDQVQQCYVECLPRACRMLKVENLDEGKFKKFLVKCYLSQKKALVTLRKNAGFYRKQLGGEVVCYCEEVVEEDEKNQVESE